MIVRQVQLAFGRQGRAQRARAWPFAGLAQELGQVFAAFDQLGPVQRFSDQVQLEGALERFTDLEGGRGPRDSSEGIRVRTRQHVRIDKGGVKRLRFRCRGAAGATAAAWYIAARRTSILADHFLDLTSSTSAVTITNDGEDAIVVVVVNQAQTEALPAGAQFHQLWLSDAGGDPVPAAEGTATVFDSLRN